MKIIYRILAVMLVTAITALSVAADCSDAEKMALEKMDKAWGDVIQKRDRAALDGMLSADYSAFTLADASDKAAAMAIMDQPVPEPSSNVTISDHYIIRCSGNTAVMTHRIEFHNNEGGKGEVSYARSIHVFEKAGGKWKILSSTGHPMDEAGNLVYMTYSGLDAYKKKDYAWFEARMHDNAVSVDPTGRIMNRTAMLDEMKNSKATIEKLEIAQIGANVTGDSGRVIVTYDMKGKAADGTDISGKYRISRNFVRENGKWMMISSHATRMAEEE
ncbi:MAG: nuclear transport factor 2 family protein [Acidobacteriota bacterium]|nr:nuclear transport factor 2 family protein [Acidobacteriota bacterium]